MDFFLRKFTAFTLLWVFGILSLPAPNLMAEDHVVSSLNLHKAILTASEARQKNFSAVQNFFSSKPVRNVLRNARFDLTKVEKAIPLLEDQELARLATQTQKIQSDYAAGALTNQQITYIIIALATAVLILVIVAAR